MTSSIANGLINLLHVQLHTLVVNSAVLHAAQQNNKDFIMLSFLSSIPFDIDYADVIEEMINMDDGRKMMELELLAIAAFGISYISLLRTYKNSILKSHIIEEKSSVMFETPFDMSLFDVQSSTKS